MFGLFETKRWKSPCMSLRRNVKFRVPPNGCSGLLIVLVRSRLDGSDEDFHISSTKSRSMYRRERDPSEHLYTGKNTLNV